MTARLARGWSHAGLAACVLENAALRVTVLPELGGKVLELVDKGADRDLLWHNPRTPPRRAPYGAYFDDWWCGGWDEIFPSGDVATVGGETLPYMGELWCVPWTWTDREGPGWAAVETVAYGTIAAARLERRLELRDDEPVLRASYRLTNLGGRPLSYLWGIHPAFAVSAAHRLHVPVSTMLVGVSSGPSMGAPGTTYSWPRQPDPEAADGYRDVRRALGADALAFGGHWATDLREGWLALTDTTTRRGVAIAFPREVFPHAWLWQVYGGWRGHHHLAMEPWTGYPMQLQAAEAAGRARTLEPGASLEAEVAFVLFEGVDDVTFAGRRGDGYHVA